MRAMDDSKDWLRIKNTLNKDSEVLSDDDLNKVVIEAIDNHLAMGKISNASVQQHIMSKSSMQQVVTQIELIKTTRRLNKTNGRIQFTLWAFGALLTIAIAKHWI